MNPDRFRVLLQSDPPGIANSPAIPKTIVAIHVGRTMEIGCRRNGRYHRGLYVHGDIDIIPPGTASRWELKERDHALILAVPACLLHAAAQESGGDPARLEIVNRYQIRDPRIEHIGWALKAEIEAGCPSGRLYFDGLALALSALLIERHSSAAGASRVPAQGMSGRRLRDVISYIEENLSQELSLKEIAGVVGLSVSHCKTAFRKSMGLPIHQYVIQRRVERARELLGAGRLSIGQIAAETGFSHESHLAYHIRRAFGVSPASLRGGRGNEVAATAGQA